MTAITRKWLSIEESATYVGLSTKTIRRRISSGDLKASRTGRVYRIHVDALDAMLQPVQVAR